MPNAKGLKDRQESKDDPDVLPQVTVADIVTDNGVVHVIDAVVLPK